MVAEEHPGCHPSGVLKVKKKLITLPIASASNIRKQNTKGKKYLSNLNGIHRQFPKRAMNKNIPIGIEALACVVVLKKHFERRK